MGSTPPPWKRARRRRRIASETAERRETCLSQCRGRLRANAQKVGYHSFTAHCSANSFVARASKANPSLLTPRFRSPTMQCIRLLIIICSITVYACNRIHHVPQGRKGRKYNTIFSFRHQFYYSTASFLHDL